MSSDTSINKSFIKRAFLKTILFVVSLFLSITTGVIAYQLGQGLFSSFSESYAHIGGIVLVFVMVGAFDLFNVSLLVDSIFEMRAYKWKKPLDETLHEKFNEVRMIFGISICRLILSSVFSFIAMPIVSEFLTDKPNDIYYQDQAKQEKADRKTELALSKKEWEDAKKTEDSRKSKARKAAIRNKEKVVNSGKPWQIRSYKEGRLGWMRSKSKEKRDRTYAANIDAATLKIITDVEKEEQETIDLKNAYLSLKNNNIRDKRIERLESASQDEREFYSSKLSNNKYTLWMVDIVAAILFFFLSLSISIINSANTFEQSKKSLIYTFFVACVQRKDRLVVWFEVRTGVDWNRDGTIGENQNNVPPNLSPVNHDDALSSYHVEGIAANVANRVIEEKQKTVHVSGTEMEQFQEREQKTEQFTQNNKEVDYLIQKIEQLEREQKSITLVEREIQEEKQKTVHASGTETTVDDDIENITDLRHLKRRCRQTYMRSERDVMEAKEPHKEHKDSTLNNNREKHKQFVIRLKRLGWKVLYTGKGKEKNIVFEQEY